MDEIKLQAPEREIAGWTLTRQTDGAIGVWKEGVGGYSAEQMADSVAVSILWELANDLLASPVPAAAPGQTSEIVRLACLWYDTGAGKDEVAHRLALAIRDYRLAAAPVPAAPSQPSVAQCEMVMGEPDGRGYAIFTRATPAAGWHSANYGEQTAGNYTSQPTPAAPAVPQPTLDRFFKDHGLWHDRETGQHLYTQDQYDEAKRDGMREWSLEMAGRETGRSAPAAGSVATDACPDCGQSWDLHEWGVPSPHCPAPATPASPAVPASASVATDLHAAKDIDIHRLWYDAGVEWGSAIGGPSQHEIFADKLIARHAAAELVSASVVAPVTETCSAPDECPMCLPHEKCGAAPVSLRMLTGHERREAYANCRPDESDVEALQRKFCEVNAGKTIPVNGMKVGAAPAASALSDFIRNATPEHKAEVYGRVMERACAAQQSVLAAAPPASPAGTAVPGMTQEKN